MSKHIIRVSVKGGPGSGHRGHAGRPGQRGGSSATSTIILRQESRLGVRPGEYGSYGSAASKAKAKKLIREITGEQDYISSRLEGWNVLKQDGDWHVINTKKKSSVTARRPVPDDVFVQKSSSNIPVKQEGGSPEEGTAGTLKNFSDHDKLKKSSDPSQHIEDNALQIASDMGFKTNVAVVSDAEFDNVFKHANMSELGTRMGGVATVTAGYRFNTNTVYLRKRHISAAIESKHEYRLFRNAIYHELGHAYHANVWGIKTGDTGKYGSGWAEQFAHSFTAGMAWSEKMVRAKSNPQSSLNKRAQTFNPTTYLTGIMQENKPGN